MKNSAEQDIKEINLPNLPDLPFDPDAKIYGNFDDEGNPIGGLYSYNDCVKWMNGMSGINPELLGNNAHES